MLECVAVCCSVLQCAVVCCSMLQCVTVYYSGLRYESVTSHMNHAKQFQVTHMNQKCHANQSHELRCTHEVHMNFSIVTHIRVTNSDVHQNYMNLKVSRKSESRTQMCHATQSHELSVSPLLTMSYIKIHHVTHTNDQNQGRLQLFHA